MKSQRNKKFRGLSHLSAIYVIGQILCYANVKIHEICSNYKPPVNLLCNLSLLQSKTIRVLTLGLLFSVNLSAQTGVAIINAFGNKILSGDGIAFELSFVVKETELNSDELQLLQQKLNTQPERYSVTLFKDDVKPELLLICQFRTETFDLLNQAFHELLFILKPRSVVFNEEEYSDYNAVILK